MKVRVISSLVGLCILAVVMAFLDTPLLNAAMVVISVTAVLELLNATGLKRHRGVASVSMLMAIVIPFVRMGYVRQYVWEIVFALVIAFFITLLYRVGKVRVEQVAMAFFFSTFVPVFFSCAVYMRDDFGHEAGGFYILAALGAAWLSDTGAYFSGLRFGKHKLAPRISPKKTVEGSVGGMIVCTATMPLLALLYTSVQGLWGVNLQVNYPLLLAVMPLFSVIGMLGDLSASVIKRNFGVKDFGNIMPGHGGILDRFDSVLFTLPAVYVAARHLQLIWLV